MLGRSFQTGGSRLHDGLGRRDEASRESSYTRVGAGAGSISACG